MVVFPSEYLLCGWRQKVADDLVPPKEQGTYSQRCRNAYQLAFHNYLGCDALIDCNYCADGKCLCVVGDVMVSRDESYIHSHTHTQKKPQQKQGRGVQLW